MIFTIGKTMTNTFPRFSEEYGHEPNNIWVEKGNEFYNRSMKSWLQDIDIETYSTNNAGKSVFAESFVRI